MFRALLGVVVFASVAACEGDDRPTAPTRPSLSAQSSTDEDADGGGGGRPQADAVEAVVTFTHLHGRFRLCEGEDGAYLENRFTYTGTSTGDPRLTGMIEVRLVDVFNLDESLGPQWGTVVIRDAGRGRKKVEGDFNSWGPDDITQGTIVGRVHDQGTAAEPTRGGGKLIANWRITYRPTGPVAQIGGATTDNRLPAGVWSGKCTGEWQEIDRDLGGAGFAATAAGAGTGRAWRNPQP